MTCQEIEKAIIKRIVEDALNLGYLVSVNDGEEWVLMKSADKAAILKAMFSSDDDRLNFWAPISDGGVRRVGEVVLIYGNGPDVIHDWSDNPKMDNLVGIVLNMAEKFHHDRLKELNDVS